MMKRFSILTTLLILLVYASVCQSVFTEARVRSELVYIDSGWSRNTINTVVFRKNAVVSSKKFQFAAYYDATGTVMLAKRFLGRRTWTLKRTPFLGNVKDAHNAISIILDGDGYLHVSWDHHNNQLHYTKSVAPYSLELMDPMPMTRMTEKSVSYPEFYQLPQGDLLFMYRDGGSGRGNLVINRYDLKTKTWKQLHHNLIDGEGKQSAYWQAAIDAKGWLHLSWVWRSSPDVASNHDLCYARSKDGGLTWEQSDGTRYALPITASSAEMAAFIPPSSELINQTSMQCDDSGRPFIATYWREKNEAIPQYHIVMRADTGWRTVSLPFRKTSFSLSGAGTKEIPIARPQLLMKQHGANTQCLLLFRDQERGNRPSAAISQDADFKQWLLVDIASVNLGNWEPCYDSALWKRKQDIHLYLQHVKQTDGEGLSTTTSSPIYILEWKTALK